MYQQQQNTDPTSFLDFETYINLVAHWIKVVLQ